nr:protein ALP1-like [Onthophagus taurus]
MSRLVQLYIVKMTPKISKEVLHGCALVLGAVLQEELKNTICEKRKRKWVREWISRRDKLGASCTLLKELAEEDSTAYRNSLRISTTNFNKLLQMVEDSIQKTNTVMRLAIPTRVKLEITLRYLATGDSFKALEYLLRAPECTISKFLPEVLTAISDVLKPYLKVPSASDEWKEIEKKFMAYWNFPRWCGPIDGKHVQIKCPPNSGSSFYNYKGTYSIILFAMVDATYSFRYIDIGGNGRASDSAIFRDSTLNIAIQNKLLGFPDKSVIIGDDAFPLRANLMKPYSKNNLSNEEKVFNYRLSRARRVVENAFGILVWRFRVFQRPIQLKSDTIDKVIWAACSLHNWLRMTSNTYLTPQSVDSEDLNTFEVF